MSHCNFIEGLCHITTFVLVELCRITTLWNGYVVVWNSSRVMVVSHCIINQGLCCILMFLNIYIGLWCSSIVMSHSVIHLARLMLICYIMFDYRIYKGLCRILTLICKPQYESASYILICIHKGKCCITMFLKVLSRCNIHLV